MWCLGVLTYNVMLQAFEHGYKYICFVLASNVHNAFAFLHFYCSAQLSMPNVEKHYRYEIIITI